MCDDARVPHADLGEVRLYYERAGTGTPELLFISGWCCDHTAFQPQFDHFARTNAVTTFDLRGVGESDQPAGGYSIPELADDAVALCAELGIERPVVIGHSLGGMIAVELGARSPALPAALVLLDPGPIDPLPETVERFRSFADQLEGPDGAEVRRAAVHDMGADARDEEVGRWIVELICADPQRVAAAVVRGISEWNGHDLLARCTMPVLLLRTELETDTDLPRLLELKPDLDGGLTIGSGHFHQIEVPGQVNAMIERFLSISL